MSWLVMQVADVILNNVEAPDWVFHVILLLLGIGLPFAVFFSWAFEITPEGVKREHEVDRSQSITSQTGKKLDRMIIVVLVLALAYFAYDKFVLSPAREAALIEATTKAVAEQTAVESGVSIEPDKSIAVLPFVNMSNDPDQEYFSDGISEELLNVLAQFPGLRVAARTSSFQFKGQNQDIADIARQLHVNHIIEGSVRKAGNRLRITAQLIDAISGFHLWSETYDRELDDVFAIQDEISASIGDALEIELQLGSGDAPPTLPSIPAAASVRAYEYYLKGRQLINQRSRKGIEEAVVALERSLELDERYAPSHAQLAIAITLLKEGGGSFGDLSMEEVLARAVPHVDRAFELNPNLAEAFGAKALLASFQLDYPTAFENGKKALALNPSYVDVINWLYVAFMNTGQWAQATKTMDQMMAVDPLSIIGRMNYAFLLGRTGRFDEAERVADDLEKLNRRASFSIRAVI
jgi:TolB-like protein